MSTGLIVVDIFLAWCMTTLIAMWIGGRIALRLGKPKKKGVFWGFMLLMGWIHIVWAFEFVVAYVVVSYQCQKNGVWTYITPEEWKKMPQINKNQKAPKQITFEGREYKYDHQARNTDAAVYHIRYFPVNGTDAVVGVYENFYYDPTKNQPLYRVRYVRSGIGQAKWLFNVLTVFTDTPTCMHNEIESDNKLFKDFFVN